MPDIEYDPSSNSNFSFHMRADILNSLFLYDLFYISMYSICLDLIEQHIYHFLSLFYLKGRVIVYEDQSMRFYCF